MPTVSAIIPTYNRASLLADAVGSVLAQTANDVEVIVVDDGSTDATPAVAAGFGSSIRYLRQPNRGVAAARNAGVRAATGEFVAFLDSDDQWLPTFLEEMLALARQHPTASAFYCGARCMSADGRDLPHTIAAQSVPPDALYSALLRASFIMPSAVLVRRSVFDRVGYFDEALELQGCEDWDLCLRIARELSFVGSPVAAVRYRLHDASLSVDVAKMRASVLAVIRKHFGPDDGGCERWTPTKRRAYGGAYRSCAIIGVLRQGDWQACATYLTRALQVDPELARDVDLFYELALGSQPIGYRGTPLGVQLDQNTERLRQLLREVCSSAADRLPRSQRRLVRGTACYALALATYNVGGTAASSRGHVWAALRAMPELCADARFRGLAARALLGPHVCHLGRELRGAWRARSQPTPQPGSAG